ncbi:MAG: phosphoribosylformylglycinamidine cyclo-ligase [Candidatus Aminicenantaceae bacterium]
MTYKKAGVDIDKADAFIKKIKPLIKNTGRSEVLGKIGGFGGLFQPKLKGVKDPVFVSSTDGVGTKLILADQLRKYDTIGIDLVAMCANDVVVTGAEPLFFLDYIACGRIEEKKLFDVVKGISKGCRKAGCALIGGETAELPDLYENEKIDLAGFCVGIVSREKIINGERCRIGDKVIGIASSGIHSNGFSLVRKIFSYGEMNNEQKIEFLKPTKIYTKLILSLFNQVNIKAMAHITGGGFLDNIPRVLPYRLGVRINKNSWNVPSVFQGIQEKGKVKEKEMFRTFNMGIGMVIIVDKKDTEKALRFLKNKGEKAWLIGEVIEEKNKVVLE